MEGVSDAVAKEKLAEWRASMEKLTEEDFDSESERLLAERDRFVREDQTGFVWVYRRK